MVDQIYGGQAVGRALKEDGVECVFGVHGYINLAIEEACRLGIKMYHFRHEQSAGFAADAYARCLRKPGVCFASASAGCANYPSSLLQAKGALSPVVLLIGQHGTGMDGLNALQEGYGTELLKSASKWTHRCIDWNMHSYWVRKALNESAMYPPGPVVLDFPVDALANKGPDKQRKWIPKEQVPKVAKPQGDDQEIKKIVKMLSEAERPMIVAGDGVYWSDGMTELKELVEIMQIPVQTRRTARGSVPEKHPLTYISSYRRQLFRNADVICIIGLQATQLEEWFEAPDWPRNVKYIQIHEKPEEIWYALPTELAATGSCKLIMRQIINCAKEMIKGSMQRNKWINELKQIKNNYCIRQKEIVEKYSKTNPIHPYFLASALSNVMDDDATVIYDSFTGSLYLSEMREVNYAGTVLDAGPKVPLGQGIGMCIGAQIARPGKQVMTLIGDGGLGISMGDIETLVRYNLPAVIVVLNNSSWGGVSLARNIFHPDMDSYDMLPELRYDKMFEAIGCHTEYVHEPDELLPALDRSFNSGKTSLVNVIADGDKTAAPWAYIKFGDACAKQKTGRLNKDMADQFKGLKPHYVKRMIKFWSDNGLDIPIEEVVSLTEMKKEDIL